MIRFTTFWRETDLKNSQICPISGQSDQISIQNLTSLVSAWSFVCRRSRSQSDTHWHLSLIIWPFALNRNHIRQHVRVIWLNIYWIIDESINLCPTPWSHVKQRRVQRFNGQFQDEILILLHCTISGLRGNRTLYYGLVNLSLIYM